MNLDRIAPYVGAVACLVLAAVLSAPYFLIDGQQELLTAYYSAGPIGVVTAIFLSILGVVIFLSSVRGRADAALVSGIMLAAGLAIFGITALWALSMEPAIVDNILALDSTTSWLAVHRWIALVVGLIVGAAAAAYAYAVY